VVWTVLHHTGSGPARPTVLETALYQIGPGTIDPFPGIAYTFYVDPDAVLNVCYDIEAEPWSQGLGSPSQDPNGEGINNEKGVSICFSGQDPTAAQWTTILLTKAALDVAVGHSLVLTDHRRVDPGTTDCPGDVADARVQSP
jgi:hypothetical protein